MIDRTPEYDNILNDCLDSVLSGQQTIAECLEAHPEHAHLLKPALQIALLTRSLDSAEMPAASVDALEMRLHGQMLAAQKPQPAPAKPEEINRPRPVRRRSAFAPLSKLAAMIAIVFLFALGAGAGTVAASANSLPGDPLYSVKRLWEAIILALSSLGNNNVDDIWLHLAQTRLDEAEALAERGTLNSVIFIDLYEATAHAITLADAQTTPQVIAFLTEAEVRVGEMPTTAATAPLRQDLLVLMMPHIGDTGRLSAPPSSQPPSLEPTLIIITSPTATGTPTATATLTPSIPPTATDTPTATATATASYTPSLTYTPTSRVSATSTHTPVPTYTVTPTVTPSHTPTATWTPIPLPAVTLPSGQNSQPSNGTSGSRPTQDSAQADAEATVRYRATQGSVYATQTQQAVVETEEPAP